MIQQIYILIIFPVVVIVSWNIKSAEFRQQATVSFLLFEDETFRLSSLFVIPYLLIEPGGDCLHDPYRRFSAVSEDIT